MTKEAVPAPAPKPESPSTQEIQSLVKRIQEVQADQDDAMEKLLEASRPVPTQ